MATWLVTKVDQMTGKLLDPIEVESETEPEHDELTVSCRIKEK